MPRFAFSLVDDSNELLFQSVLSDVHLLPRLERSHLLDVSNSVRGMAISEDVFDVDSAEWLISYLKTTPIQTLSFYSIKLSPAALRFLVPALKETKVDTLYFYENGLGDVGIKILSAALPGTQIQALYLKDNGIGDEGASALRVMLPQTQIGTLSLEGNLITVKGVKALVDGLQRAKVDELSLSRNLPIRLDSAEALTDALQGIKVHTLDFSKCSFNGEQVLALVKGLRGSPVQKLALRHNSLDPAIAQTLPELLALTQVNTLDLGNNYMDDIGVTALFQGLHKTQVSTIYIDNNKIKSLKEALKALHETQVHTLKVLDRESSSLESLLSQLHRASFATGSLVNKLRTTINIKELTEYLAGSNVTRVLGVTHPELDVVLKANRVRKKNSMIAFGQAASRLGMNAEVVTEVVGWLPDGATSGTTSLLASGSTAIKAGFDTNAAQTAIHAMNLEQSKLETYARGRKQTGRVLRGETLFLNDESSLPRPIFSQSRSLFFLAAEKHCDDLGIASVPVPQ